MQPPVDPALLREAAAQYQARIARILEEMPPGAGKEQLEALRQHLFSNLDHLTRMYGQQMAELSQQEQQAEADLEALKQQVAAAAAAPPAPPAVEPPKESPPDPHLAARVRRQILHECGAGLHPKTPPGSDQQSGEVADWLFPN